MFCYQCQEALKNEGCAVNGVCGKKEETADLQDLLIFSLRGAAAVAEKMKPLDDRSTVNLGEFLTRSLFATITNTNFDDGRISGYIVEAVALRDELKNGLNTEGTVQSLFGEAAPDCVTWKPEGRNGMDEKAKTVGVLTEKDEDKRSLRELILYGLKGLAAYTHHASVLGYTDHSIYYFIIEALSATTIENMDSLTIDDLFNLTVRTGETAVSAMALLDKANTETYGHPEITQVEIGVGTNPGILISGHDLKDMETLLHQTEGTGIDVYTHSEMLPANYYPAFKKYSHFRGNYGNAWWRQNREFESFNGPILMTTNCITPVQGSYKDRIFTTDIVGYPGIRHIEAVKEDGTKDFSEIIELAKTCAPPKEIENGTITGGFAHNQITQLKDTIVDAVKSGAVKRFIVMAGCDGRQSERGYFSDVAEALPNDAIILTAGCAKYRYNKLDLGDIGGIPRVLDAGQCNDSYSLALAAMALKDAFGLDDLNDLPISFDVAWYEQKAVAVLLALLSLGVKGIRLGPTLPAFLSANVASVLVEKFDIKPIETAQKDVEMMMAGK